MTKEDLQKSTMRLLGHYNWKGQADRLVYLGCNWSGNGWWHQFRKIGDPRPVWCEVTDSDLHSFEETPPADQVHDILSTQQWLQTHCADAGRLEQLVFHFAGAGWEQLTDDMQAVALGNGWNCCLVRNEDGSCQLNVLDPRDVDFGPNLVFPSQIEAKAAAPALVACLVTAEGLRPGDPWPGGLDDCGAIERPRQA